MPRGRVLLPGLIDAHVHVVASSHDLSRLALQPPSLVTAESSAILRGMLQRGFTTVRDAGGADYGLQEAVARGLFEGPRLFIAGLPISQTGGHGDMRPRAYASATVHLRLRRAWPRSAPSPTACRTRCGRGARASCARAPTTSRSWSRGGVASPADPLESRSSGGRNRAPPSRRPTPRALRAGPCLLAERDRRGRCRPACAPSSTAT